MSRRTICYSGFLGGSHSMGKVGEYLVKHWLARPERYQVCFRPWTNDYMAGCWRQEIAQLIIENPSDLEIDQWVSFCSIHDARQEHVARLTTPWLYYELSSLPKQVVENINTNDQVYVTSSFVRKVFVEHGVRIPISVLGHGIDPACYHFHPRAREGTFDFLCVAEHTTRKNLPTLIRCFERAFPEGTGVRLLLKLGLHGEGDLRRQITRGHAVVLLTEDLETEADLADLYRRAHCFVLPTRAEGFGMPFLEAMATGLPVIATDYGGHLDFCTKDNSYLIRNRGLVDSDPACFPNIASQWGDPDEDHLIELMREVYRDYDRALALGQRAWKTVAQGWTWDQQLARAFP